MPAPRAAGRTDIVSISATRGADTQVSSSSVSAEVLIATIA